MSLDICGNTAGIGQTRCSAHRTSDYLELAVATISGQCVIISALKQVQKLNENLQNKYESGSQDWHDHESIDDIIHDILGKLGD